VLRNERKDAFYFWMASIPLLALASEEMVELDGIEPTASSLQS
jgi:hypothetical protein